MKAKYLRTTGEESEVVPANGETFSLEELQGYVGGYIELLYLENDQIMVLNEEGKLENLPMNRKANEIFVRGPHIPGDYIAGDVIVCSAEMVD